MLNVTERFFTSSLLYCFVCRLDFFISNKNICEKNENEINENDRNDIIFISNRIYRKQIYQNKTKTFPFSFEFDLIIALIAKREKQKGSWHKYSMHLWLKFNSICCLFNFICWLFHSTVGTFHSANQMRMKRATTTTQRHQKLSIYFARKKFLIKNAR